MKTRIAAAALAAACLATTGTVAQPYQSRQPSYYLPIGTPVSLVTRTELNTKDNRAGDRFYLEVAEPVQARGATVIPAGTIAVGEIVRSERNGHFGKSGKMDVRILYLETPERRIPLNGQSGDRGKSGTVPTVAAVVAFGILGGLVHGTSAYIKAGTPVTAYLGGDLTFNAAGDSSVQVASNR